MSYKDPQRQFNNNNNEILSLSSSCSEVWNNTQNAAALERFGAGGQIRSASLFPRSLRYRRRSSRE